MLLACCCWRLAVWRTCIVVVRRDWKKWLVVGLDEE